MSKKGKNYADLEKVRVFHNPKTDLVEITGKYVEGGNFSVVLPKGTLSDIKVRAEIYKVRAEISLESQEEPSRYFPAAAQISYEDKFNEDVYRDGKIWRRKDNKYSMVYLPLTENEKYSKFPLGIDLDSNPILVDLHSETEKNNIFISSRSGSGGSLVPQNLFNHVLRKMPDTTIIANDYYHVNFFNKQEFGDPSRTKHLKDLSLLEHLRDLHSKMVNSKHGVKGSNEVIFFENFEQLVANNINPSPSARTDKAVRAETLDLILEISKIKRSEFNISFVFFSNSMNSHMNAFLDTCSTVVAFNGYSVPVIEQEFLSSVFGTPALGLQGLRSGEAIIKNEGLYAKPDYFKVFINPELVKALNGV